MSTPVPQVPSASARPIPIPILLYHSITRDATAGYRPYAVDPVRFRTQMELVAQAGSRTLTVRELGAILADPSGRVPERSVVITFDDGFDDVHREALPVLDRLGLTATAFLVAGHVGATSRWLAAAGEGHRRLMSWSQVRELAAAGIEIGSHSHTHPELDTLPAHLVDRELDRSRAVLEDGLGAPVTSFAYPYGYHTPGLEAALGRHGYQAGCAVKHALSHPGDDRRALGRAMVSPDTTDEQLAAWLDGRGLPLAWAGERPQTIAWRAVRRARSRYARLRPHSDTPTSA
jgi:peptidoglycan/xylan/chitin deacetylase (PgdA/CDA1 family)